MYIIRKGRPENCDKRLEKEIKVYDFLDKININYEMIDHDAANNMEIYEKVDAALPATACKNLFLVNRQGTKFYLLMMPREKDFRTRYLKEQLGLAHLSFAGEDYMKEYLNVTPGSVSIMGLIFDTNKKVELIIDEDVIRGEYVRFHPCIFTSSIRIKTEDFKEKLLDALSHEPVYVDIRGGQVDGK